ncbi:hypothetical protein [Virgibacillus sp. Bac330]|uniref:hypothetical protein n=1 Tax=Virgibacillus sp. Bac330 TaxID=2419841 RepID=UPI000EF4B022|nr:hypothetical protein [Virgibacillus sp. Bac330]
MGDKIATELIDMLNAKDEADAENLIIDFMHCLKKMDMDKKYKSDRILHLGYVPYLVGLAEEIQQKNYKKVVDRLNHMMIEDADYVMQPRFYFNLIPILEKVEKG